MHVFYEQVRDFCRLMHEVLPGRASNMPERVTTALAVREFAENFLLCPGTDAARRCIERDFAGALGFARAVDGVNRQLQLGSYRLPRADEMPRTRFYVLSSAVQDYLQAIPV